MRRRTLVTTAILLLAGALIFWNWPRLTHREGDMRDPRSEIHAAVIGDDIYIAGGIGFFRTLSSCERYNVGTQRWHWCPSLPRALHHVALASDGERLFASGGYVGLPFRQDSEAALLALEPGADEWSEISRLPHPIGQHAMTWRQGRLYLVGGQNGDRDLDTIWSFDLAEDRWTQMAPMPTPRHSHAIAVSDGFLYVAGGRSATLGSEIDRVERYDFENDSWESLPPMPVGRGGHAAFVLDDELHIVGGETLGTGTVMTRHDIYDPDTRLWRGGPPLAAARHGLATVVAGNQAYAIGGGSRAGMHTIYSVTGTIFPIEISR